MGRIQVRTDEVFAELPRLESERLVLQRVTEDDTDDLFAYTRDADLLHHLPLDVTPARDDALACVRAFGAMYDAHRVAPWGITRKDTGRHIGLVGFESWNVVTDRAELGFLIARDQWGQGFATEAARRAMRFGFERMRLNRIEARVTPGNTASRMLLTKLGMRYEGLLREHSWWRGAYRDLELYALLAREFYSQP